MGSLSYLGEAAKKAFEPDQKKENPAVAPSAPAAPSVQETQPEAQSVAAQTPAEEEPTKAITLRLPMSLYRQLANMKYENPGETLNTLGIKAIENFVGSR